MAAFFKYNPDHHIQTNKYLLLLMALIGILSVPAIGLLFNLENIFYQICFTFLLFSGSYTTTQSKKGLYLGLVLSFLTLAFFWIGEMTDHIGFKFLSLVFSLSFFLFLLTLLIRAVWTARHVDTNAILGGIVGYLILGLIGALLFSFLEHFQPNSLQLSALEESNFQYLYFSFVTLSTLGYGDILPATAPAMSLAILVSLSGQIYLTILIAILVGKYISGGQRI